jgi:hypothetical protein
MECVGLDWNLNKLFVSLLDQLRVCDDGVCGKDNSSYAIRDEKGSRWSSIWVCEQMGLESETLAVKKLFQDGTKSRWRGKKSEFKTAKSEKYYKQTK